MLFSIVIPVYNAKDYLKQCVDGILEQEQRDFELLLVDDGSTDGSGNMCDDYAGSDSRIKAIHKENGGQASARKAGIFAASGDYICYVDADDRVKPEWLVTIAHAIEKWNGPDMVVFGAEGLGPEGVKEIPCYLEPGYYGPERMAAEVYPFAICDRRTVYTRQLIFPVAWNKAFKRELLRRHYCRDERIRRGEDTAFVYECILNAKDLCVCGEILYEYNRVNTGSVSAHFGFRLTENDVYLSDYLRARLGGYGFGADRQINDFFVSKIIRSVLWKAGSGMSAKEAAGALKRELEETGLLNKVTMKGLPAGVKAVIAALHMKMYLPVMVMAGRRVSGRNAA